MNEGLIVISVFGSVLIIVGIIFGICNLIHVIGKQTKNWIIKRSEYRIKINRGIYTKYYVQARFFWFPVWIIEDHHSVNKSDVECKFRQLISNRDRILNEKKEVEIITEKKYRQLDKLNKV